MQSETCLRTCAVCQLTQLSELPSVLNLLYLWVFPSSKFLFTVCYCAAHGPLAFSIATWRNSLVPMDIEKMASLFIHIFPPLVFMTIRCACLVCTAVRRADNSHRHYIPNAEQTYPALKGLDRLDGYTSFWMNLGVYVVWQGLYYEVRDSAPEPVRR